MALENHAVYRRALSPSCRQLEPCRSLFFKSLKAMLEFLMGETTEDSVLVLAAMIITCFWQSSGQACFRTQPRAQQAIIIWPRMTTGPTWTPRHWWSAPVSVVLQTSHSHRPIWWHKRGTPTRLTVILYSFFTKHCKLQPYKHNPGFRVQAGSCISPWITHDFGQTMHWDFHPGKAPVLEVTPTFVPVRPHASRRSCDQDYC